MDRAYLPRLQSSFDLVFIRGAICDAMAALGYPTPKEEQVQVVEQFLLGRDVFVSLPTGGGKSLCYGCLPIVFDTLRQIKQQSIVLVISPLNALMEDQVGRFSERGLKAAQLSTKDDTSVQLLLDGQAQLVYGSPENFITTTKWRDMLALPVYQNNIVGLAVDEAHLVEKW